MAEKKSLEGIIAKEITIDEFMKTPNIVRYVIKVGKNPTEKDYSKMIKLYSDLKNEFASDAPFKRDSKETAFREWEDRPELKEAYWNTSEGLNLLVDKTLLSERKQNAFFTFTPSSNYPRGTLQQSTAYVLMQLAGSGIFPEEDHFLKDGTINPNRKTSLMKGQGYEEPKIDSIVITVMIDTSAKEYKKKISNEIKKYVGTLASEKRDNLIN